MVCFPKSAIRFQISKVKLGAWDTYLALSQRLEDGALYPVGVLVETHVLQHHDGGKQKRSRVRKALARNV